MNIHVFAILLFLIVGCQSWENQHGYQSRVRHGQRKSKLLKNFLWPFARPEKRSSHPNVAFVEASTSRSEEEESSPKKTVEDCSIYDEDREQCSDAQCFYCSSDEMCHPDESYAPDCTCGKYSRYKYLCNAQGCDYDEYNRICYGYVKKRRFSANLCAEEGALSEDGIWYNSAYWGAWGFPIEESEQPVGTVEAFHEHYCYENSSIEYRGRQLEKIYQTQELLGVGNNHGSVVMGHVYDIPVLEDGKYKLVMHFAELWKDVTRHMGFYLNGIESEMISFHTNTLGKPVIHTLRFDIVDNLATVLWKGIPAPATPSPHDMHPQARGSRYYVHFLDFGINYAVVKLHINATMVDTFIPFLNAFYIEKLD